MSTEPSDDLDIFVRSANAYRTWARRLMVVGMILCTWALVSYASDLGKHSRRSEVRIVVLATIADLLLAFGLFRSLRTPGIVKALRDPQRLSSYRLVHVHGEAGPTIGVIWLYTKDGASYEVPIMSKEPDAGERAFAALMKHAPHLVETRHTSGTSRG